MATSLDQLLQWYIGEDVAIDGVIYESDGVTVQNITGWAITFSIQTTAPIVKTVGAGIVLTSPTTGQCTITIASADTGSLSPLTAQWFLQRTDSGADAILAVGTFSLLAY